MPKWMDDEKLRQLRADIDRAKNNPTMADHIGGYALLALTGFILYLIFWPSDEPSKNDKVGQNVPVASKPHAEAPLSLVTLDAKIADDAVVPMDRQNFPKFYDMLGRSRFDEANRLSVWAARAAAKSSDCGEVLFVGQSDTTTKKQLVWYVNCGNGQRVIVNEAQAKAMRAKFDEKGLATGQSLSAAPPVQSEESRIAAKFKGFDDILAETVLCQEAVQATAINRGSVDFAWTGDKSFNADNGIVTFQRDFDAANRLGGQISSRYHCEVDADRMRLTKLMIRELNGWRIVFGG